MLDLFGGLVFRIRQRDGRGENVVFAESGIKMHEVQQTPQHQAGADEEHAGQGDFRDDERVAKPAEASAGGGGSSTFVQASSGIDSRGLDSGYQSEEDSSGRADDEGEGEDGRAHMNLVHAREVGGEQSDQRFYAADRHDEA